MLGIPVAASWLVGKARRVATTWGSLPWGISPRELRPMSKVAFSKFASELLSLYGPSLRSPRTRSKLKQVLDQVGKLPEVRSTADLTPTTIAAYCDSMADLNPNTVNGYLGYLRRACNYAVARGYLRSSPFEAHVFRRRPKRPADRHLSASQVARILDHLSCNTESWAGHRLYALVAMYAFTGLRRDEALKLQRGDLDLTESVVNLTDRSPLKTEHSAVPVPIPEALATILNLWLPRTGSIWVFPNPSRSGPWTGGEFGKRPLDQAKAAALAAGVEGFTFAGLRQTWATMAESRWGLSELVVQRILRHSTPKTQRLYRKADLANLTAAVRLVDFRSA